MEPHVIGPDANVTIAPGTPLFVPVLTSGRTYVIAEPVQFPDIGRLQVKQVVSLYGNVSGSVLTLKQPDGLSDIIQLVASLASGSVIGCELHFTGSNWMVFHVWSAP